MLLSIILLTLLGAYLNYREGLMPDRNQSFIYTIRFTYRGDEYHVTKESDNPASAENYVLVHFPGARKVMIVNKIRKSELQGVAK